MEYRITISPDPTRIVNQAQKRNFMACTDREQYCILRSNIKKAILETQQGNNIKIDLWVYFEKNEAGNLHCHGIVKFYTDDTEIWKYFQRMVYRNLGRIYVKGKIDTVLRACCDMVDHSQQWQILPNETGFYYKSWLEYCLKDQSEKHLKAFPKLEISSEKYDFKALEIEKKGLE